MTSKALTLMFLFALSAKQNIRYQTLLHTKGTLLHMIFLLLLFQLIYLQFLDIFVLPADILMLFFHLLSSHTCLSVLDLLLPLLKHFLPRNSLPSKLYAITFASPSLLFTVSSSNLKHIKPYGLEFLLRIKLLMQPLSLLFHLLRLMLHQNLNMIFLV